MTLTVGIQELAVLFVSLFTLFSPLSNIGPFSSLVGHLPRPDQRKLAGRVFVNVLIVMLAFVWLGDILFEVLGVTSATLSAAGGIALIIAGVPMMLGWDKPEHNAELDEDGSENSYETQGWQDLAVIPMTFPMSIGGTTAAYLVTASGLAENAIDLVAVSVVVLGFAVVIFLTHYFAPPLANLLSPRGRAVVNRIGGIILTSIAVSIISSALKGLFPILAGG